MRFEPNRVSLADRAAEGVAIDATRFHKYRIVNRDRKLFIHVDGQLELQSSIDGIHTRVVRFGNRPGGRPAAASQFTPTEQGATNNPNRARPLREVNYQGNASHSLWRSVSARVSNRRDHSIDWRWSARQGFPDQFRRDRMIAVERNANFSAGNSGYSGWTQTPDGKIIIVDYTESDTIPALDYPLLRAYIVREQDLV
ncbi:MAG: hypothetical protein M3430_05380 [Acidobacteriota bacterium]|nr:hypothetical protein [Acidobacteriota bacterium]